MGIAHASRWWVYQQERFPLMVHGPVVAAFSFSAVSYSTLLRDGTFNGNAVLLAFVSSLLFFLLLRISDEFKDADDDARFRPYRPVPRGLVKLKELAVIVPFVIAVQLGLALWFHWPLALLLLVVWCYLGLMHHEFFVVEWLKRHPVIYMLSHMMIMPLIDFYATAWDWWWASKLLFTEPPQGLIWFLLLSFFNGLVIELGRKIRAPKDEEVGVETYSMLWGAKRATAIWLIAVIGAGVCALLAAQQVVFLWPIMVIVMLLALAVCWVARPFLRKAAQINGKRLESMSGIWVLIIYLSLGALPWLA